jgi:hypothetical protein
MKPLPLAAIGSQGWHLLRGHLPFTQAAIRDTNGGCC